MKVLMVTKEDPGNPVGGLGTFIRDLSTVLKEKIDLKIMLVKLNRREDLIEEPPPSDMIDYFVEVKRTIVTEDRDALKGEEAHEILEKCLELWEEWQPDVIHVNDRHTWMPFRYLPNTVYSLHLSMSDLVGMRGMDHYWFHELKQDKDACAKASALIVYSKFMQKVVWDKLCDFASPLVLPLGFVPEAFHFNKPPEKIVVSYFGRLAQNQKGFVEFVQAVDMINQDLLSRYTVEFNIYGVGDFPEWLPSRRINTVKHLDKDEVKEAYAESHVVVMPSKYEPFGLVGLEAIASGCVLFCTTGLGMDEYIVENKNFVPIESDPYNIKDNLENFLQNPGKYLGREKVISETVKDWTWERCAQEHLKVYHQVAVGRAGMLKWSHGQQAETAKKAWERTGDLRKKKLKEVFNKASQWISGEKVLVINGTEDEVATYKNTGKEIIHHRFVPNSDSQISFQTEYILVAPDSVEQTVFIYGPEYAPHLQYTIQELHRITKDSVIFGISFGERTFGKNSIFKSKENLLKYIDGILSFEKIEEEFFTFEDSFDHREAELGLFHLRKRNVDEMKAAREEYIKKQKEEAEA